MSLWNAKHCFNFWLFNFTKLHVYSKETDMHDIKNYIYLIQIWFINTCTYVYMYIRITDEYFFVLVAQVKTVFHFNRWYIFTWLTVLTKEPWFTARAISCFILTVPTISIWTSDRTLCFCSRTFCKKYTWYN